MQPHHDRHPRPEPRDIRATVYLTETEKANLKILAARKRISLHALMYQTLQHLLEESDE